MVTTSKSTQKMAKKKTNRIYVEVDNFKNMPIIKLAKVEAFLKLVEQINPEILFCKVNANSATKEEKNQSILNKTKDLINSVNIAGNNTEFYFVNENTVYAVNGNGYKTLEDFETGTGLNFVSGAQYYASKKAGFENAEEYQNCINDGFSSKENFEAATKAGFIGGIAKLNASKLAGELKDTYYNKIKNLKKDGDLFTFAQKNGFDNWEEFNQAILSGYATTNAEEYRTAQKSGFGDAEDYEKAKSGAFENPNEFAQAKEFGIESKTIFDEFQSLTALKEKFEYGFFDQASAYKLLDGLESGKLISFAKISERLKKEQSNLKIKAPRNTKDWLNVRISKLMKVNTLPEWYTTSFNSDEELKAFLINDQKIQEIGEFDQNSDVFIRK